MHFCAVWTYHKSTKQCVPLTHAAKLHARKYDWNSVSGCRPGDGSVDGNWSEWSKCKITSQGGRRTRTCTNPAPQKEGLKCLLPGSYDRSSETQIGKCNVASSGKCEENHFQYDNLHHICYIVRLGSSQRAVQSGFLAGECISKDTKEECGKYCATLDGVESGMHFCAVWTYHKSTKQCVPLTHAAKLHARKYDWNSVSGCRPGDGSVDGNWSEWSFSKCTIKNGMQSGKRRGTRACNNPAPKVEGLQCLLHGSINRALKETEERECKSLKTGYCEEDTYRFYKHEVDVCHLNSISYPTLECRNTDNKDECAQLCATLEQCDYWTYHKLEKLCVPLNKEYHYRTYDMNSVSGCKPEV